MRRNDDANYLFGSSIAGVLFMLDPHSPEMYVYAGHITI